MNGAPITSTIQRISVELQDRVKGFLEQNGVKIRAEKKENATTLEDVVEEIVGEINDEFDSVDVDYTKLDTGTYIFEGKTSLNDIIKLLDLKQDVFDDVKGENESIGGLLLEINSSMPKINEPIYFSNYEFLVVSANHRRIKKVKFIIHEKKEHSQ